MTFTPEQHALMDATVERVRDVEVALNTLWDTVPAGFRPLICEARYKMKAIHDAGQDAVTEGLLPVPDESNIATPPVGIPADMEGAGGK